MTMVKSQGQTLEKVIVYETTNLFLSCSVMMRASPRYQVGCKNLSNTSTV